MNSPEDILKAQRSLSVASGTKQLATWLLIGGAALAVVAALMAMRSKQSVFGALLSPLMLMSVSALLRSDSVKQVRALESMLGQ